MNYLKISIGIFLALAASRFIPHPPNFTPIITAAIFSGYLFKNLNLSIIILGTSMILTDILIGTHSTILFVYIPLFLVCFLSNKILNFLNFKNIFFFSLGGSILFFIISNFGVWFAGELYVKNFEGLVACYYMAIPFFKNTLISTLLFSYLSLIVINYKKKIFLNY